MSKPQPRDCLDRHHHHSKVAPPRSQDYVASMKIGGCAHGSVTTVEYTQKDTDTHADTKPSNSLNMRRFVYLCIFGSCSMYCLSTLRQILVLVRTQMHPTPNLALCCHSYNTLAITHSEFLELTRTSHARPPQRSRRSLKRSSKVRLSTHASNHPRKTIVPTVLMERSGIGTYQESQT